MASEQSIIGSLEFMSETADGQMQALNVLGQISDQQVQQLMKLRELKMADMSSKQAYQAAIIQEQAADHPPQRLARAQAGDFGGEGVAFAIGLAGDFAAAAGGAQTT